MARVIPFPSAAGTSLGALFARLHLLESVESADEAVLDTVVAEEQRVLAAIIATPAGTLGEVEHKLAALLRRVEANEGILDDAGVALLTGTLAELRNLAKARAVG